ncbi:MAG: peptide ABC transporter substrate-binding protein [Anaerolineae bacterium]|nr:peptide ABC transporter substrate-binding protein [Anaerolineae bacterium]
MKKTLLVLSLATLLVLLAACQQAAAPAPAPTSAPVVQTVIVEKPVEKVVEKVVEKPVEKQVVVTTTPAPAKGADTLIIGMSQEPSTLHQFVGSMAVARQVQEAVYEPLVTTLDYDFQPNLVETLPTLENGGAKLDTKGNTDPKDDVLEVTFKLKAGLKWCDGQPVKASDMVFMYNTQKDEKSGVTSRVFLNKIDKVAAPDDRTFVMTYKAGETDSLYFANYFSPLPEHRLKGKTPEALQKDADYTRMACGWGPYMVKEWVAGDRIVLQANPNYYKAGFPKVKNLIYRIIPDTNQLLAQLASGDIDFATSDGLQATQYALYDQFQKQGLIKIYEISSPTWEHMDFNTLARTNKDSKERKAPHPLLGDKTVRQAIATCIDRQAIVNNLYSGKSTVMNTMIPKEHWAYAGDANIKIYKYDEAAANKMLDDAGWAMGADKIRAKGGVKMQLNLRSTSGNVLRERSTQLIKAQLAKCGIDVTIELVPSTVWFGEDTGLAVGDFELGIFAWVGQADPGGDTLYACDQIPTPDNKWEGQNYMGWCNETASKAILAANSELKRDDRKKQYAIVQKEFTEDMISLPLFQRLEISGSSPKLKNAKPNATEYATWNIAEWEKG